MGIDKLTASLLTEADREAGEIVKSAEWHVRQMLAEEKAKSADVLRKARAEADSALLDQRNERLAWARLEAKRIMAEAREDAIKGTLEDLFGLLAGARKAPEYRGFLRAAVKAAAHELGGGSIAVHVCKGDAKLLDKLPAGCRVKEDLEGAGGAMVEAGDGRVRVNLTLEALFEARRDELRKQIYDTLFKPDFTAEDASSPEKRRGSATGKTGSGEIRFKAQG